MKFHTSSHLKLSHRGGCGELAKDPSWWDSTQGCGSWWCQLQGAQSLRPPAMWSISPCLQHEPESAEGPCDVTVLPLSKMPRPCGVKDYRHVDLLTWWRPWIDLSWNSSGTWSLFILTSPVHSTPSIRLFWVRSWQWCRWIPPCDLDYWLSDWQTTVCMLTTLCVRLIGQQHWDCPLSLPLLSLHHRLQILHRDLSSREVLG